MKIRRLATVLLVLSILATGCGNDSDQDSPDKTPAKTTATKSQPRTGDVSQANATPDRCDELTKLQGGVTVKEECGDARVTMTRKKARAKMIGQCSTGKTWFELVAGTNIVSSTAKPKPGQSTGNRVVINIGPKTGTTAGSMLKRAPKDGTYTPISMVATVDGSVYSAFADTTATLRGGRTEGTVVGTEPDGTKITVEFTCRKLQAK